MSPEQYARAVLGTPTPEPPATPPLVRAAVDWLLGREPVGTQQDYALAGRRQA